MYDYPHPNCMPYGFRTKKEGRLCVHLLKTLAVAGDWFSGRTCWTCVQDIGRFYRLLNVSHLQTNHGPHMTWRQQIRSWEQGFHHTADLLIRRGTAMGPLIPTLFLTPAFLFAAWVFQEAGYLPWLLSIASVAIVGFYFRHYERYAKIDPDRLQSEEYRYEMKRMHLIAAKELPAPVPVDALELSKPTFNPNLETPKTQPFKGQA